MTKTNTKMNKYKKDVKVLVQISLTTIAIILIVIASQLDWRLITFSVGTSIIASVIILVWQSLFGADLSTQVEDLFEFNQMVYQKGLNTIYIDGFDNEFISKEIEKSFALDLMYNTARYIAIQYGYKIMQAIEHNGCRVRILIADPQNPIWQDKTVIDGLCPGTDIPKDIEETTRYINSLIEDFKKSHPQLTKGSIELRYFPYMPTSSMMIVNEDVVRYTPYLTRFHSEQVPVFEITKERGGSLFLKYQTTFEKVWAESRSTIKAEWPLRPNP